MVFGRTHFDEEYQYAMDNGTDALEKLFEEEQIDLFNIDRDRSLDHLLWRECLWLRYASTSNIKPKPISGGVRRTKIYLDTLMVVSYRRRRNGGLMATSVQKQIPGHVQKQSTYRNQHTNFVEQGEFLFVTIVFGLVGCRNNRVATNPCQVVPPTAWPMAFAPVEGRQEITRPHMASPEYSEYLRKRP